MANEVTFIDGLIVKEHTFSDGGTIQKISFKVEEIIKFLQQHNDNGWVNAIITKSQSGKPYAKLDTWKPNNQQQSNQQGGQNNEQQAPQQQGGNYPAMPNSTIDNDQTVPF